jgi:glycosyltransferase involved in cell wall biosynthesis
MAMPEDRIPTLSIGLPVYNGGADLALALDTLRAQSHADFELILADNASTDTTEAHCRAAAAADPRIRYIRHAENRGAEANFAFVLAQARAPLFMWAAADDQWSPDFAARCVAFLQANPGHVSAVCPARFDADDGDPLVNGDGLLQEPTVAARVRGYLSNWHRNSVYYSVFRREALVEAFPDNGSYLGQDWAVMLRLTRHGPSKRLDGGEIVRGARGVSSSTSIFGRYRRRRLDWLLPFGRLSTVVWAVMADQPLADRLAVAGRLLWLNQAAARAQFAHALRQARQ